MLPFLSAYPVGNKVHARSDESLNGGILVDDVEAGAHDRLGFSGYVPSQAKARPKSPGIEFVKRAVLPLLYDTRGGAESDVTEEIVHFVDGGGVFVAQSQVQRESREEPPVVLNICAIGVEGKLARYRAYLEVRRGHDASHEIVERRGAGGTATGGGVSATCECAKVRVVGVKSQGAFAVLDVEDRGPMSQKELTAKFSNVVPMRPGNAIHPALDAAGVESARRAAKRIRISPLNPLMVTVGNALLPVDPQSGKPPLAKLARLA